MEEIKGFFVQAEPGLFLGKSFTWVRHSQEETPFVHDLRFASEADHWAKRATTVIPAVYSPNARQSQATGPGISFQDFLASRQ